MVANLVARIAAMILVQMLVDLYGYIRAKLFKNTNVPPPPGWQEPVAIAPREATK